MEHLISKGSKHKNGNIIGCFIGYALLGLTITAGVAMAILISGASNFVNFIILLALLNGFSYLLVRGEDYQARFHVFMRVGVIIILLEIILVGGLMITKIAGLPALSRDNVLVPLMIIAGYEVLKIGLRSGRRKRMQPQEILD
ncbi:MAG: hypothetical protein ACE5G7_04405 [Candidatus Hydrothermarchaeaceae archaeon]